MFGITTHGGIVKKVKTHRFNGVCYAIDVEEPFDALCEAPVEKDRKPTIRVARDVNTSYGLQCLIHECLHASNWAKSEEIVDRVAVDIGKLLWRLGFRKQ